MSSESKYFNALAEIIKYGDLKGFIIDNPDIFEDDSQYQNWLTNISSKIMRFIPSENIKKLEEKVNSTRAKIKEERARLESNKQRRLTELVEDARSPPLLSDEEAIRLGPKDFLDNAIKSRKQIQKQLTQQLEELKTKLDALVDASQIVSDIDKEEIHSKIISISEERKLLQEQLRIEEEKKDIYIDEIINKYIDAYFTDDKSTGIQVIRQKLKKSLPQTWELLGGKKNRKTIKNNKKSKTYKKLKKSKTYKKSKRSKTYKKLKSQRLTRMSKTQKSIN